MCVFACVRACACSETICETRTPRYNVFTVNSRKDRTQSTRTNIRFNYIVSKEEYGKRDDFWLIKTKTVAVRARVMGRERKSRAVGKTSFCTVSMSDSFFFLPNDGRRSSELGKKVRTQPLSIDDVRGV